MALVNPFSIQYGDRTVGGTTDTLLHGPYVIEKTFDSLRLVFDIIVKASSYDDLQAEAEAVEDDFRKRDQSLEINLSGSAWSYTFGDNLLKSQAQVTKSGNRETDRGFSRAYTITITAELPADDQNGLRELEVHVDYDSARKRTVSMRGVYTALDGVLASAQYLADFDSVATPILTGLDGSAAWELVDEQFTRDRVDHTANFQRQYTELLFDQSSGTRDDDTIKDHRVTFSEMANHPGDSFEDTYRLRRVVGNYECSVDVEQGADLRQVYREKIRQHVLDTFASEFSPQVFAVEDVRVTTDETNSRISVALQIIYQADGGSDILEVQQSVAYRESRQIDYTPIHTGREFEAELDPGWAMRERVWSRTVYAIGEETPKLRIGVKAQKGPADLMTETYAGQPGIDNRTSVVVKDGWNVVGNTSQVTRHYIGDPSDSGDQISLSILTETVTERYSERPQGGTSSFPTFEIPNN